MQIAFSSRKIGVVGGDFVAVQIQLNFDSVNFLFLFSIRTTKKKGKKSNEISISIRFLMPTFLCTEGKFIQNCVSYERKLDAILTHMQSIFFHPRPTDNRKRGHWQWQLFSHRLSFSEFPTFQIPSLELLLYRNFKFFESPQKRLHLIGRNQLPLSSHHNITLMKNKNNSLEFSLLTSLTLFRNDELAGASFFIVRLTV